MGTKLSAAKAKERIAKQNAYNVQYSRENYRAVGLRFRRDTDADIIAWLDKSGNKNQAVAELIRAQIAKEQGE